MHFETDKTDEIRAMGRSKEGRYGPQIQYGLLTDREGFPLEYVVFPGNKGETRYLVPVLESLVARHGRHLKDIVVVADAGLLSAGNCWALQSAGFDFIVGSKTSSAKNDLLSHLDTEDLNRDFVDKEIFECDRIMSGGNIPKTTRRVVYQYKADRAKRDLKVLADQQEYAKKVAATPSLVKPARFVTTTGNKPEFDQKAYDLAVKRAGLKGYVTSLPKNAIDGNLTEHTQTYSRSNGPSG